MVVSQYNDSAMCDIFQDNNQHRNICVTDAEEIHLKSQNAGIMYLCIALCF